MFKLTFSNVIGRPIWKNALIDSPMETSRIDQALREHENWTVVQATRSFWLLYSPVNKDEISPHNDGSGDEIAIKVSGARINW